MVLIFLTFFKFKMNRQQIYLDISINDQPAGRMIFELYNDIVPRTVENFHSLCIGDHGIGHSGKLLSYKNCPFHRIISKFMAQTGDFVQLNGTGGESIFGTRFEDENFEMKHSKPGILSMANAGPNTNASQFFITFVPCPWLDGKHVVFGELVDGIEVLKQIELAGSRSGAPNKKVVIIDCGDYVEPPPPPPEQEEKRK